MQPELVTRFGLSDGSSNVGDVLASIRRLIAQDQIAAPPRVDPSSAMRDRVPTLVLAHEDLAPEQLVVPGTVDGVVDDVALSPDEEAEFAEAEAALAQMLSPQRAAEPIPELPPHAQAVPVLEMSPQVQIVAEPKSEPVNFFATSTADEPTLRDLLREILREELQGDFGIQASNQIRTLIRSEVEAIIREMCNAE